MGYAKKWRKQRLHFMATDFVLPFFERPSFSIFTLKSYQLCENSIISYPKGCLFTRSQKVQCSGNHFPLTNAWKVVVERLLSCCFRGYVMCNFTGVAPIFEKQALRLSVSLCLWLFKYVLPTVRYIIPNFGVLCCLREICFYRLSPGQT